MYKNKPFEQQKTSKTAENSIYTCTNDAFDTNKAIAKEMNANTKNSTRYCPGEQNSIHLHILKSTYLQQESEFLDLCVQTCLRVCAKQQHLSLRIQVYLLMPLILNLALPEGIKKEGHIAKSKGALSVQILQLFVCL